MHGQQNIKNSSPISLDLDCEPRPEALLCVHEFAPHFFK